MEIFDPYTNGKKQPINDFFNPISDLCKGTLPDIYLNRTLTLDDADNLARLANLIQQSIKISEINELADNGDINAQLQLADMFLNGNEVPKNNELANYWYKRVALGYRNAIFEYEKSDKKGPINEHIYIEALVNLGFMYKEGLGVQKSDIMSIRCYKKAAKEGDAFAQFMLGKMYLEGYGIIEKDVNEAIEWLTKSAKHYNNTALNTLIDIADKGVLKAQKILGLMYLSGEGVGENLYEALKWFFKAAEQGDRYAIDMINKTLPLKMTEKLYKNNDQNTIIFVRNLACNHNLDNEKDI